MKGLFRVGKAIVIPSLASAPELPTTGALLYVDPTTSKVTTSTSAGAQVVESFPVQTGNSGKYLTTDGSNTAWSTVAAGDSLPTQTGHSGKVLTTNGSAASWASGIVLEANDAVKFPGQAYSEQNAIGTSGSAKTIDWNDGNSQTITLDAAPCVLTLSNPKAGASYLLVLTQDSGGSRTVTWPSSIKWPDAVAPTLTTTASRSDLVTLYCVDASTPKYIGNFTLNFTL